VLASFLSEVMETAKDPCARTGLDVMSVVAPVVFVVELAKSV
jgi:hypothetical protein